MSNDEIGRGHPVEVETPDRAGERQQRLLVAADDLGRDAEAGVHPGDEGVAVAGVARGRRRHEPHGVDTEPVDDPGVALAGAEGALQRLGGEDPGAVDVLPEPHDLHPPVEVDQGACHRVDVGHEQPDRVGPAVDGGHPAHGHRPSAVGAGDPAAASVEPVPYRRRRRGRRRAGRAPVGQSASASSPNGLTPARRPARGPPGRAGTSPGRACRRRTPRRSPARRPRSSRAAR